MDLFDPLTFAETLVRTIFLDTINLTLPNSALDSDLFANEVIIVLGCMVLAFSAVCMASIISFRWALILFYICR
jgi:hypothetical protein